MEWVVIWGIVALSASLIAGLLASHKNRDYSSWMAWTFILPPLVIVLLAMPVNKGLRRRRPTLDELDRADGGF